MLFPGMAPARKAELIEWYTISTKYIIMISRMYKAPFTSVISFSPTTTLWNWCLILPIQIRKCKYLDQGYMDNVGHLIPGLIDTRAPVLNHSAISFLFFQSRPGQKSEWPRGPFYFFFNHSMVFFNIFTKQKSPAFQSSTVHVLVSVYVLVTVLFQLLLLYMLVLLSYNQDIILSLCFSYWMLFQNPAPSSDMVHITCCERNILFWSLFDFLPNNYGYFSCTFSPSSFN